MKQVELWYKTETGSWTNTGLTKTAASDTFSFTATDGDGNYYFDLVAENSDGNRSSAASGSGDAMTVLDTVAPTAGSCTPPASVTTSAISMPYSGTSDSGSGRYYFCIVAEDIAGNRSAEAFVAGSGPTIYKLWFSDGFEGTWPGTWTNSGCDRSSTYKYAGTYAAQFNSTDSLTKSYSTFGKTDIKVEYARYTRTFESDDHFIAEWYYGSSWNTLDDVKIIGL